MSENYGNFFKNKKYPKVLFMFIPSTVGRILWKELVCLCVFVAGQKNIEN
jgi:hypothetical protein